MRVNLAVQVLSHSVAAGIQTLCAFEKMPADAKHTAEFVETFDQMFNACNSRAITSKQQMGHAMSSNTSHLQFFDRCLDYLDNIRVPKSKKGASMYIWLENNNSIHKRVVAKAEH